MDCESIARRFNPSKAASAQEELKRLLRIEPLGSRPRIVAGLDAAYTGRGRNGVGIGVAVAFDIDKMELVGCVSYIARICVPYIPGLLAFREMRILAPALSGLMDEVRIDLIMVDGHGIAHPRGMGIASHVGIAFNTPSIGVAKRLLYGKIVEDNGVEYIVGRDGGRIGARVGGVYVSPGHMVDINDAIRLVEAARRGSKLPEPTRIADSITKRIKREGARGSGFSSCSTNARSTSLLNYI